MKTPDVHVRMYAMNLDAPQRAVAARWLETACDDPAGTACTWHAPAGFPHRCTQQRIVQRPLSLNGAPRVIGEWPSYPHACITGPTDRHAPPLGRLPISAGRGGNVISDAHLAAIAIGHGATPGTFDREFERFAGLRFDWLQRDTVHEF